MSAFLEFDSLSQLALRSAFIGGGCAMMALGVIAGGAWKAGSESDKLASGIAIALPSSAADSCLPLLKSAHYTTQVSASDGNRRSAGFVTASGCTAAQDRFALELAASQP